VTEALSADRAQQPGFTVRTKPCVVNSATDAEQRQSPGPISNVEICLGSDAVALRSDELLGG